MRGDLVNSVIHSGGNIRSLSARSMSGSQVYAGVATLPPGQTLPTAANLQSIAQIGKVTLKGATGLAAFSNSVIAADRIGSLVLSTIPGDNGGTPFGVAALRITSLSGTVDGKPFRLSHLVSGADANAQLVAQGVTPGDFVVNLL